MTRDDLDALAAFLRARLRGPMPTDFAPLPRSRQAPADHPRAAAETAARRLRTVEQAVVGVEAYFELAARHPDPPGLAAEERRAGALWQALLNMAALWPDHADNPRRLSEGTGTGPRPGTVPRPAA